MEIIGLAIGAFAIWSIYKFIKYKFQSSVFEVGLKRQLSFGKNLKEGLEKELHDLNSHLPKKLNPQTTMTLVDKMVSLQEKMTDENIAEIYGNFVSRHICKDSPPPYKVFPNMTDEKVIMEVNNMCFFKNINGKFMLDTSTVGRLYYTVYGSFSGPSSLEKRWVYESDKYLKETLVIILFIYEGGIEDGFPHGFGIEIDYEDNKLFFEGEFKNGKKHGYGKDLDAMHQGQLNEGCWSEGEWKDDKQWNVTIYDKNGKVLSKIENGELKELENKEI
jgi:hypothetical protein